MSDSIENKPLITPQSLMSEDTIKAVTDPIDSIESTVDVVEPIVTTDSIVESIAESVITNQIDIDGVVYTLDSNGNAIDEQNSIKYTKEQIAAFEGEPTSLGIKELAKMTNIVPIDEDGKEIEYEDTPQGIAKYANDVYQIGLNQGINNYQEQLFNTYPLLGDIIDHLQLNNGSLEGFGKKLDYSSIKLDKDNETQLVNIITEARIARGESNDKIEKYIKYLKSGDSLFDESNEELKYLIAKDTEFKTTQAKQIEIQKANDIKAAEEYWGIKINNNGQLLNLNKPDSIYDTINKGKLKINDEVYIIPDKIKITDNGKITYKTRDDFFNYLYSPVEVVLNDQRVKMTQHEVDLHNENLNRKPSNDIFDAYKRFVKYDTSQFIKENVNRVAVNTIIRKLSTKTNTQGATQHSRTNVGKPIFKRNN
jgi:hypothetical protein